MWQGSARPLSRRQERRKEVRLPPQTCGMPRRQCADALPSQLLGRRRWKQQPLLWKPTSATKMLGERQKGAMLVDANLPPKAGGPTRTGDKRVGKDAGTQSVSQSVRLGVARVERELRHLHHQCLLRSSRRDVTVHEVGARQRDLGLVEVVQLSYLPVGHLSLQAQEHNVVCDRQPPSALHSEVLQPQQRCTAPFRPETAEERLDLTTYMSCTNFEGHRTR